MIPSEGLIRLSLRSFLTPTGRAKARPKYFAALRALRFVCCQTSFGSNPSGKQCFVLDLISYELDLLSTIKMARPEGFEPPTLWFVARYSIQLSYGRINLDLAEREGFEPSMDFWPILP